MQTFLQMVKDLFLSNILKRKTIKFFYFLQKIFSHSLISYGFILFKSKN